MNHKEWQSTVWSTVSYAADSDIAKNRLEVFLMWYLEKNKQVKWKEKVTNADVLQRLNETRSILDTI